MNMKCIVVFVFVITTATVSAQGEEPRRGNPDIAVLRDFVAELRQAGNLRGARHSDSDENSSSEEHTKYRNIKPLIVNPPAEPTTEKHRPVESSTGKYIPKYSQIPTRQRPTTPYPSHTSTYRYKYRPPYDIQKVNDGVGTILRGVGSARLSEILRGSFMFTRNDRVRSVANSVIDSIFGQRDPALAKNSRDGGILFPLTGL